MAISVPNDFLTARFDAAPRSGGHGRRPPCHVEAIGEAAGLLSGASRPLLIAGGGVIAAEASAELARLARRLGAPVITTVMGRGALSERDPLWHGVLPNSRATEAVIQAADVILAVGCRFAHRSTQGLLLNLSFAPSQTLIHLDLDPTVIGRLFKPQVADRRRREGRAGRDCSRASAPERRGRAGIIAGAKTCARPRARAIRARSPT